MLIDLTRDEFPKKGNIVKVETSIIIKDILQKYKHYPLLCQQEKYKIEENSNIEYMLHHMLNYMYEVVTEEQTIPPKWDNFVKCKVDWAGNFI